MSEYKHLEESYETEHHRHKPKKVNTEEMDIGPEGLSLEEIQLLLEVFILLFGSHTFHDLGRCHY